MKTFRNFNVALNIFLIYHNVLNPFINLTSQNLTGLISNLTIIFTLFSFLKVLKGLISHLTVIPQHISHIFKGVILISHSNLGANLTSHKRYIGASVIAPLLAPMNARRMCLKDEGLHDKGTCMYKYVIVPY